VPRQLTRTNYNGSIAPSSGRFQRATRRFAVPLDPDAVLRKALVIVVDGVVDISIVVG
jgi:hypothetical protein